jgi:hypothetical protein
MHGWVQKCHMHRSISRHEKQELGGGKPSSGPPEYGRDLETTVSSRVRNSSSYFLDMWSMGEKHAIWKQKLARDLGVRRKENKSDWPLGGEREPKSGKCKKKGRVMATLERKQKGDSIQQTPWRTHAWNENKTKTTSLVVWKRKQNKSECLHVMLSIQRC